MCCDILWNIISAVSCVQSRPTPLERLCLSNPDSDSCKALAVAFTIYHTIRNRYAEVISKACIDHEFTNLIEHVADICRVACCDFELAPDWGALRPTRALANLAAEDEASDAQPMLNVQVHFQDADT